MRNPSRCYEICCKIAQLWSEKCPDWRFCQLVDNFFSYCGSNDCYYVEDDEFLAKFEEYMENIY